MSPIEAGFAALGVMVLLFGVVWVIYKAVQDNKEDKRVMREIESFKRMAQAMREEQ